MRRAQNGRSGVAALSRRADVGGGAPSGLVLGLPTELTFLLVGCDSGAPALQEALTALLPFARHAARDAREAVVRIAEAPPDLLFVDGSQPRALDLCRALKSQ
ncbi:MAG TPA: hypothetical protein VHB97_26290 [Polyangia bacterium]|nr:hypothetical protein [Polyangia bacterium]